MLARAGGVTKSRPFLLDQTFRKRFGATLHSQGWQIRRTGKKPIFDHMIHERAWKNFGTRQTGDMYLRMTVAHNESSPSMQTVQRTDIDRRAKSPEKSLCG